MLGDDVSGNSKVVVIVLLVGLVLVGFVLLWVLICREVDLIDLLYWVDGYFKSMIDN